MTTTPGSGPRICSDEGEVAAAIADAIAAKQRLRVRGAGHSYPSSIISDPGAGTLEIVLDPVGQPVPRTLDPDGTVTVWAGTHLGPDPRTAGTDDTNTLLPVLFGAGDPQADWALPDTGGIIHQTVGGFLSTGSSGGTTTRPVEDSIEAFEVVGADGVARWFRRSDGDPESGNPFFALGVSLGLLGVITRVAIKPVPAFYITGNEAVTDVSGCAVDLFAPDADPSSLATWLQGDRFTRFTWWPQPDVDRIALWQAEVDRSVTTPVGYEPKPYQELAGTFSKKGLIDAFVEHPMFWLRLVETVLGNLPQIKAAYEANQAILGEAGSELGRFAIAELEADKGEPLDQIVEHLLANQNIQQLFVCAYYTMLAYRRSGGLCQKLFTAIFESEEKWQTVYSPMIMKDLFITNDVDNDPAGPQQFHDRAWHGLPMDNQIIDELMPTEFTELWIPIDQTQKTLTTLRDFYAANGYAATGSYACELYGAAPSSFWISPSQGASPRLRVDLYYFQYSPDDPGTSFFPQFWDLLHRNGIDFRPHWGKYLPPADGPLGPSYLASQYAQLPQFLALRQNWDTDGVFLSDYWRSHLGVS